MLEQIERLRDALLDAGYVDIDRPGCGTVGFLMEEWTNGPDSIVLIRRGDDVAAFRWLATAAPHALKPVVTAQRFSDLIAAITKG